MERRTFLNAVGITPLLFTGIPSIAAGMPTISYYSIPASDMSKVDCLQSTGYYGGKIVIKGKNYAAMFSAPESEYLRRGRAAVERELRAHVDAALRAVWLRLSA